MADLNTTSVRCPHCGGSRRIRRDGTDYVCWHCDGAGNVPAGMLGVAERQADWPGPFPPGSPEAELERVFRECLADLVGQVVTPEVIQTVKARLAARIAIADELVKSPED